MPGLGLHVVADGRGDELAQAIGVASADFRESSVVAPADLGLGRDIALELGEALPGLGLHVVADGRGDELAQAIGITRANLAESGVVARQISVSAATSLSSLARRCRALVFTSSQATTATN